MSHCLMHLNVSIFLKLYMNLLKTYFSASLQIIFFSRGKSQAPDISKYFLLLFINKNQLLLKQGEYLFIRENFELPGAHVFHV